jgi:hypothetical protein
MEEKGGQMMTLLHQQGHHRVQYKLPGQPDEIDLITGPLQYY